MSWWRGESNTLDAAGTNNGTLVNGVTYEQGMVGSAFRFGTTSGQRVWVPDSPAFQLTNSLTIEGWFKIYGGTALVQRGDNRPGLDPFTLAVQPDGKLDFQMVHSNNAGDYIDLLTLVAVPTNVWKHLAATLDGTTGTMRIYLDGQVVAETNTTVRPLGPLEPAYDASLCLGNAAGHSIEYPFVGLADEVGIYSRALSASEIEAIYNAGSAGKCAPTPPPACVPAPSGLVSWWRAESNALDSADGNNGEYVGNVTFTNGVVGQGFLFNGVDSYVRIPHHPSLNFSNALTVELWFQDLGSIQQYYGLVAKRGGGAQDSGPINFGINVDPTGPYGLQLYFNDPTVGGHETSDYLPVPAAGVFHHLAATFQQVDATHVEMGTFIDGQLVKTQVVVASLAKAVNEVPVTIGVSAPTGEFFKGVIDEVSLYNRALTASEIEAIYNAGSAGKCAPTPPPACVPAPSGLVSWWRAESNALDSADGNNGEYVGNVTFTNGVVGQGFLFNGVDSYVRIPHHPSLNFSNALTVELWFQDLGSIQQYYGLVAKRGGGAQDSGPINFGINVEPGGSHGLQLYFNDPTVGGHEVSDYLPVPATGVFHHLAATFRQVDATHVEMGTFIDGQLVKTQVVVASLAKAVNEVPVTIGVSAPTGEFFKGVIDEVSLYNRALMTNEIQAIYNAASAGKCVPLPPANHPPVADASATLPLVISVNNTNATVVLDGSRSSDSDGDPLQYYWLAAGAADPFATGIVAVVKLPVGSNVLTLTVDDGLATGSQTFGVEVITAAQAVERLVALVEAGAPRPHPLIATLSAALAAIDRSNPTAAINQLMAFQNKVRAQVSPLDPVLAETFIQMAQEIIDALSGGAGKAHGKITHVSREADGKARLKGEAAPGALYIIEASTNLVDWEKIGVATDNGAEVFEFEDAESAPMPARFYRIASP